jgi:hypothetical protein
MWKVDTRPTSASDFLHQKTKSVQTDSELVLRTSKYISLENFIQIGRGRQSNLPKKFRFGFKFGKQLNIMFLKIVL